MSSHSLTSVLRTGLTIPRLTGEKAVLTAPNSLQGVSRTLQPCDDSLVAQSVNVACVSRQPGHPDP
jgi:hypothetical protein